MEEINLEDFKRVMQAVNKFAEKINEVQKQLNFTDGLTAHALNMIAGLKCAKMDSYIEKLEKR